MAEKAYIVSAVRTPGGKKNGSLSDWHPADMGAAVLDELVKQTGVDPKDIDDVIFPNTEHQRRVIIEELEHYSDKNYQGICKIRS